MLLLTSVNDRLNIITTTAAPISVHTSWVDTATVSMVTTITPGRTNTNIASATTTSVAGSPAASTQRNVKTMHIRNTDAALNNTITVQHTDGATAVELYKIVLGPGEAMEYTDQAGFGGGRMAAVTGGVGPIRHVTTSGSGTYTTPPGVTYLEVELVGAGGGGGSGQVGGANAGVDGTDTSFGTIVGGGGKGAVAFASGGAGHGGTAVGGDVNIPGEQGHSNAHLAVAGTSAAGNSGGASYFGGAGAGLWVTAGGDAVSNSGSGGGGGATNTGDPFFGGFGGGAGGYCRKIITSPAASYAYAVGVGGAGGAAVAASFAGGRGGDGMIIVTEYYR